LYARQWGAFLFESGGRFRAASRFYFHRQHGELNIMRDRREIEEVVRSVLRESAGKAAMPAEVPGLKDTPYWEAAPLADKKPEKNDRVFGKAPPTPDEQNELHRKFWGTRI
jgi:hypothetical protein